MIGRTMTVAIAFFVYGVLGPVVVSFNARGDEFLIAFWLLGACLLFVVLYIAVREMIR